MDNDYARVERAIRFLEDHFQEQPDLAEVAQAAHLSPYHFQRIFRRWAGISPKRFLQFLTVEYAKQLLDQSETLLDASYEVGLSGPGRLHDLFVSVEAATPGEYKNKGEGLEIRHGFADGPFGTALIAMTPRGICHLSFCGPQSRQDVLNRLHSDWKGARLVEDHQAAGEASRRVFPERPAGEISPVTLYLKGTNFQLKVWRALLQIPAGSACSYQHLAEKVGLPNGSRAVARAVATNPVSYLIPCHRVIRKEGSLGGYAWGPTRKRAMLGWEAARFGPNLGVDEPEQLEQNTGG